MLTPKPTFSSYFSSAANIGELGGYLRKLRFAFREDWVVPKPLRRTILAGIEQVVANRITDQMQFFPGQRAVGRIASVESGTSSGVVG